MTDPLGLSDAITWEMLGEIAIYNPAAASAIVIGSMLFCSGDSTQEAGMWAVEVTNVVTSNDTRSRELKPPKRRRGHWTCTCRADRDMTCEENATRGLPFAIATAHGPAFGPVIKKAKSAATAALMAKPKHVPCVCVDPKGQVFYTQ